MFQESRIRPLALLFCKEITRYGQKQGYSAIQHLPRYNQCVSNHFLFLRSGGKRMDRYDHQNGHTPKKIEPALSLFHLPITFLIISFPFSPTTLFIASFNTPLVDTFKLFMIRMASLSSRLSVNTSNSMGRSVRPGARKRSPRLRQGSRPAGARAFGRWSFQHGPPRNGPRRWRQRRAHGIWCRTQARIRCRFFLLWGRLSCRMRRGGRCREADRRLSRPDRRLRMHRMERVQN